MTTRTGTRYHLDCRSGDDAKAGTSPTTAWRTLAKASSVTFRPGDSLVLRRGTACSGVLKPQGSGTASAPIRIGAYGRGALPAVDGGGARATVLLENVQGYEIRDLDVSNRAQADGTARAGIYVLLTDYGTGSHYVVDRVKVHDVPGCDCLQAEKENAGGVIFKAAGSAKPTTFSGIRVTRNQISAIDNLGVGVLSTWSRRDDLYPAGTNSYVPITNVRVAGNRVGDTGGDGIMVSNATEPRIDHNLVNGFGRRAYMAHAAILAFNSDRAVVEYNEVTGGVSSPPSFAFSVDAGNRDLTYQYNYSHDNAGPFMLFCAFAGTYGDGATIRYNVSQDDKDLLIGNFDIPVVANGCDDPIKNVKFYNNVIRSTVAERLVRSLPHTPIAFSNNIFSGRPGAGSTIVDSVSTFDHNLYENVSTLPSGDHGAVNADPRFTRPGTGPLGYRLQCGSPAIGTGAAIPGFTGRDLFGNRVPNPPNIGVFQGACVR
ncbi:right-handed parallel beta-helix repeat-containing protein [Actinomadura roseirufa]|uniref:right-handed parallel beta-helix repeat-containing protein n=1 Tax=Actinomadura roseirufa TaxID=2094049 RepID=UPI0010418FE2|nr:right-handed parallel beta-helix repeat-containing protein [Actinomadura roseirufa]